MPGIFISYRRDDTGGHAGHLAADLIARFGRSAVFMDVDSIQAGEEYENPIQHALDSCDVALVLIGKEWLAPGPGGRRRIDEEDDWVRREVAAALERSDVRVIPVLVEGATMPEASELPPDISRISKIEACELSNRRWNYDFDQLCRSVERVVSSGRITGFIRRPPTWAKLAAVGAVVAAIAVAILLGTGGGGAKEANLEPLPPLVENGEADYEGVKLQTSKGTFDASRQTDQSKPRIDVRLHNTGDQRSVLTSARFVITRFERIQPCGLGAGLFASAHYDLVLPSRPRPGQAIEVPINQQLGPDQADRFSFRVGSAKATTTDIGLILIYELRISVLHDNSSEPQDVGEAVVALPGVPNTEFLSFAHDHTCSDAPSEAQREAATFGGARSPELDGFFGFLRSSPG